MGLPAPARRRPAPAQPRPRAARAQPSCTWPSVRRRGACGAWRGTPQHRRPPLPPPPRSLARWLALPLRSGSAEGGGVGCRRGGRGGSCILAVGEESEPALLVSRRAQLQPRGPARPLAARPGLLGWARARPRAVGGVLPPPRTPSRRAALGAGHQGFPTLVEGRARERESPRGPEQTSRPPHEGVFATPPVSGLCLCSPEVGWGAC